MTNSEVMEKLKKLLRLGQSSNPNEAALAMEKAFELASRHNIDMESVDLDDETRRILHQAFGIGQRFSLIRKLTIAILERFFNVSVVMDRPNWLFVGTATDIEIAIYVHGFLVGACSRSLRAYQAEQPRKLSPTKRNSFIAGFMYGITNKLRDRQEQMAIDETKTAVALRAKENREGYIADNFKIESFSIERGKRNQTALMSGFIAGKETEISKAVNGTKAAPLQLTF